MGLQPRAAERGTVDLGWLYRRHRRLATMALLMVVGIVGAFVGVEPASANGGIAMAVDVKTSNQSVQDQGGGACTWDVTSDVVVVNLTSKAITASGVSYSVSWTGPNGSSGVQDRITVLNDAGLAAGFTLGPDERRTFSPLTLRFGVPCDATNGDLAVRLSSSEGSGSGDAPFLSDGTAVPPGALGMALVAVPLAAGLILVQRRRSVRALRV